MEKQIPKSMEQLLENIKNILKDDRQIYETFERCYTNTLNTTVKRLEDHSTYVITGDIPAMWLRDSAAQLRPYLVLAKEDKEIGDILEGLVKCQFHYINIDGYANAFNESANGNCWEKDETEMNDWIWERKYEIDSLCYPIQFAYLLWKNTGRTSQFDEQFVSGVEKIIQIWKTEQYHEERSPYSFIRRNTYCHDTLSRDGKGALVKSGIGLTWSGFRPSDDACTYGYLIPSNMFAVVVLQYVEEIASTILKNETLMKEAKQLKEEIFEGIETYGITKTEAFGDVYAYEVDGYGQCHFMDDANVPSLLSMEYLGYKGKDEKVAEQTRKYILSEMNPYYYKGSCASGIGSPHTPIGYIWHISLAMQGLTSKTKEEKKQFLDLLVKTDGNKGVMHEGFHVDDPTKYTREWFSWANAMFSELVLAYCGYSIQK